MIGHSSESLACLGLIFPHWAALIPAQHMEEKDASVYRKHDHGSTTNAGHSRSLEVFCGLGTELGVVSMNASSNACTAPQ